jgi:CO/xanthine dehydrogenase Mo-binding subunit
VRVGEDGTLRLLRLVTVVDCGAVVHPKVILLDNPDQPSAGGGEAPLIAVAPAIGNAIFRACGVRLRAMPLVPGGRVPRAQPGSA